MLGLVKVSPSLALLISNRKSRWDEHWAVSAEHWALSSEQWALSTEQACLRPTGALRCQRRECSTHALLEPPLFRHNGQISHSPLLHFEIESNIANHPRCDKIMQLTNTGTLFILNIYIYPQWQWWCVCAEPNGEYEQRCSKRLIG